jgi:tetratricopeptide (TPR) repeat protein
MSNPFQKAGLLAVVIVSLAGFYACQSKEAAPKRAHEEALRFDSLVRINQGFDTALLGNASDAYQEYVKLAPNAMDAAQFLQRAGDLQRALGHPQKALDIYQRVVTVYPRTIPAEVALLSRADILENDFQNLGGATDAYKLFLEKYPTSKLAPDARNMMERIGKGQTDEEYLKEMIRKSAGDSIPS